MIQDHYTMPKIEGVTGNHHNLSHHGQDKGKIDQLRKIESKLIGCLGNLLRQMKSRSELGSSLLDNTSVLFGSNLGNANAHHACNLLVLLAGGGFKHGQYVTHDQSDNIPLSNLFVTMLSKVEIETKSFGQSNGKLSWQMPVEGASRHK